MSLAPRLLPLVGVAVAGVIAVKALSSVRLFPASFAATAVAATPAPPPAPRAPPPRPAAPAVCARGAADLARDAGLSPAELQTLQNLGARRGQLDARETALDSQLQLINAASLKLDARLKGLVELKAQIQGLLGQADAHTADQTDKLVTVYEKMKPRDAGALMAALDDKVRVPVAARIAETKPAILAAIMSQMGTVEGKKLTESLAHRFQQNAALAQAATSLASPPPAPDASAVAGSSPSAGAAPDAATPPARKKPRSPAKRSGVATHKASRPPAVSVAKAPAAAAATPS